MLLFNVIERTVRRQFCDGFASDGSGYEEQGNLLHGLTKTCDPFQLGLGYSAITRSYERERICLVHCAIVKTKSALTPNPFFSSSWQACTASASRWIKRTLIGRRR